MTAVTMIPIPQSETAAILHMIERAARDPSVDIDKLQRLMELRAQIETKASERAFGIAMTAAQSEMRAVATDSSNSQTHSRFASFYALDRAIRPVYTRHGFSMSFDTGEATSENNIRVQCHLAHSDGYTRCYHVDMPSDGKGARGGDVMSRTHATGSAITYGRRYLLIMIFNLAIGGDASDDDGNRAGEVKRENPHVTRPEDVTDAKRRYTPDGTRIDWIDTSDHRVQRLSKAQARVRSKELADGMHACTTVSDLVDWGIMYSEEIAELPADWEEIFQGRYQEHLDALRGAELCHCDPQTGEIVQ